MGKTRARIYAAADKEGATEHSHQVAVFAWATSYEDLRWLFAVPNGGDRDAITAGKLKAEGVKAGVHDIFLPLCRAGYKGLFIEMKKPERRKQEKGGLSDVQIEFGNHASRQGYKVHCCYHWRDAVAVLAAYIDVSLTFDP